MVLNFFFFALILIFTPGEYPGLYPLDFGGDFRALFLTGAALAGSLLLYLSWRLAVKLTGISDGLKNRILPIVLIAGVICASFFYAAGIIAQKALLWQDTTGVLLGYTLQWFFVCVYFLSAFLLIIHSQFRKYAWKTVFFLLPLIPSWLIRIFSNTGHPFLIEYIILLFLAGFLLFTGPIATDKLRD